jgi:hypothetical protein
LDPFTEISLSLWTYFVVIHQAEHKNDKDNQQRGWQVPELATKARFLVNFHTKRRNLGQMWPNSRLSPTPLGSLGHIFVVSYQAEQKNDQGHQRDSLISTEICDKCTEMLRICL